MDQRNIGKILVGKIKQEKNLVRDERNTGKILLGMKETHKKYCQE